MPRLAMLALVVWALALSVVQAAQAVPAQNALSFTAGAWRGGPVADGDGQVQACAMFAPAGAGVQLYFRLSSGFDFALGLVSRAWNIPSGTALPMVYWVDNGARTETQARATRGDTLHIDIADRESIFQQFRRGLWLNLASQRGSTRFSLKGTAVALERLRTCATALAGSEPTEPPAAVPPPVPVPPAQPPRRGK